MVTRSCCAELSSICAINCSAWGAAWPSVTCPCSAPLTRASACDSSDGAVCRVSVYKGMLQFCLRFGVICWVYFEMTALFSNCPSCLSSILRRIDLQCISDFCQCSLDQCLFLGEEGRRGNKKKGEKKRKGKKRQQQQLWILALLV